MKLVFEILYEYKDFELKQSEIKSIVNVSPVDSVLNELMSENLIVYNPVTHGYRFRESDQAYKYLKTMTKV